VTRDSDSSTIVNAGGANTYSGAYVFGETLTLKISTIPDTSTQVLFKATNGAIITGGSSCNSPASSVIGCPNSALASSQICSSLSYTVTMPSYSSSAQAVTLYVGWSTSYGGGVSYAYVVLPAPAATPSQTSSPTPGPTVSSPSFAVDVAFVAAGVSSSAMLTNSYELSTLLANDLAISTKQVLVLSVTSSSSSSRRRALDSSSHRQLLSSSSSSSAISMQIIGLTSSSQASSIATTTSSYLSSNAFITAFNSATGLSITGVSGISTTVSEPSISSFTHTCSLNSQLSLSWSILNSPSNTAMIKGALSIGAKNVWIAGGIVADSVSTMVASSPEVNRVFLYGPQSSTLGLYNLLGLSSSSITQDSTERTYFGITGAQSVPSFTMVAFERGVDTGVSSDPRLRLNQGDVNRFIWAHGSSWGVKHPLGDYGFSIVDWNAGTCVKVKTGAKVSPWFVFLGFIPIFVFNSHYSPLRRVQFIKRLRTLKLPCPFYGFDVSISSFLMVVLFLLFNALVLATNSLSLSWYGVANALGKTAILNFWLALLPTAKSSFLLPLLGIPFERAIKWHKLCTYLGLFLALMHLIANNQSSNK